MGHRRLETSIAFKGITMRSGLSLRKVHFYLQFRMAIPVSVTDTHAANGERMMKWNRHL